MSEKINFLAILVFDRGDGWASIQPHVFSASHPEIVYQLALARGEAAPGSQRFVGFSEMSVAPSDPPTAGEMIQEDPNDLVKEKAALLVFQDPRWQGVPYDEQELRRALQGPAISHEPRGLDAVDWERLEHAYGSARDVPAFLRMLGAEDMEVRSKAFGALVMTILHQGSLYTATVAAVPFLLRLVEDPDHPARLETMDLVRMIVKECSFDGYLRRREEALEKESAEPGPESGEPDIVGSILQVLTADLGLLEKLASDEDPDIREMVVFVLDELSPSDSVEGRTSRL